MLSREFKAGIAVIVAAGIIYWGISFLKGSDIFEGYRSMPSMTKQRG